MFTSTTTTATTIQYLSCCLVDHVPRGQIDVVAGPKHRMSDPDAGPISDGSRFCVSKVQIQNPKKGCSNR